MYEKPALVLQCFPLTLSNSLIVSSHLFRNNDISNPDGTIHYCSDFRWKYLCRSQSFRVGQAGSQIGTVGSCCSRRIVASPALWTHVEQIPMRSDCTFFTKISAANFARSISHDRFCPSQSKSIQASHTRVALVEGEKWIPLLLEHDSLLISACYKM